MRTKSEQNLTCEWMTGINRTQGPLESGFLSYLHSKEGAGADLISPTNCKIVTLETDFFCHDPPLFQTLNFLRDQYVSGTTPTFFPKHDLDLVVELNSNRTSSS